MGKEQTYAVRFKLADGEHLASISRPNRNDALAMRAAKHMYDRKDKGIELIALIPVAGMHEIEEMKKALLAANPDRVPLDELTGGEPNMVLHDPSLVEGGVGSSVNLLDQPIEEGIQPSTTDKIAEARHKAAGRSNLEPPRRETDIDRATGGLDSSRVSSADDSST